MLNEDIRRQLTDLFSHNLRDLVTLHFFTQKTSLISVPSQECHTCHDAGELLEEVVTLSDKLNLEVHDLVADMEMAKHLGVERIPGLVMQGKNRGVLRYFGVPAGYEFGVLIEALKDLSQGTTQLSAETRKQISQLPAPVHIKVLVTPTCPYCPLAARLAHQMAVESSQVTADIIEVSEFPDVTQRYHVFGVPKIVLNEKTFLEGALPEAQFLNKVLEAASLGTRA